MPSCAAKSVRKNKKQSSSQGGQHGRPRVSGKEILAAHGVAIPPGTIAFSPDQAVYAATELGGSHWVVKAQIHAGARGKAGGVKFCRTYHEVQQAARDLLGKRLVTSQTGPEGKPVQRVYVELADPFEREIYLGYVLDRNWSACASSPPSTAAWRSRRSPRTRRKNYCR